MHPELFQVEKTDFLLSVEDLKTGKLTVSNEGMEKNCTLEIPVIDDAEVFTKNIYDTWLKVEF